MIIFKVKKGEEESEDIRMIELPVRGGFGGIKNPEGSFGRVIWVDSKKSRHYDHLNEVELYVFIGGKFKRI